MVPAALLLVIQPNVSVGAKVTTLFTLDGMNRPLAALLHIPGFVLIFYGLENCFSKYRLEDAIKNNELL